MSLNEYHGIIINLSQKDKMIFRTLNIIGQKKLFLGIIIIYKVSIPAESIDSTINKIQQNLVNKIFIKHQNFYAHFYRDDELIVVFSNRIFHVTPEKSTWNEVIEYGRSLNIPNKQLDFLPCRFEDEIF